MPELIKLPINTPLSVNQKNVSADNVSLDLINGYIDTNNDKVFSRKRPGLSQWLDLNSSAPVDGLFWSELLEKFVCVSGGSVYTVDTTGTATDKTNAKLGVSDKVSFAEDSNYVYMCNNSPIIYINDSTSSTAIADTSAPSVVTGIIIHDRYFLANNRVSADAKRRFYRSDIGDPLSWSPANFVTAEASPDEVKVLDRTASYIYIFGTEVIELFIDDGISPFSRVPGGIVEIGVSAPHSVASLKGTSMPGDFIFFDSNHQVSILTGVSSTPISTSIDNKLAGYKTNNMRGYIGLIDGKQFYVLNIPDGDITWVFNLQTQTWSQWSELDTVTDIHKMFLGWVYAYSPKWGFAIVGSKTDGKIYKISHDYLDDAGTPIDFDIFTGHVSHGVPSRKFCIELQIDIHRGDGVADTAHDPTLLIQWKNDGELAWNLPREVSLGKIGDTVFQKSIYMLGSYYRRQWRFRTKEAVNISIGDIWEKVDFSHE